MTKVVTVGKRVFPDIGDFGLLITFAWTQIRIDV